MALSSLSTTYKFQQLVPAILGEISLIARYDFEESSRSSLVFTNIGYAGGAFPNMTISSISVLSATAYEGTQSILTNSAGTYYAYITDTLTLPSNFTITFWYKPQTSMTTNSKLFYFTNGAGKRLFLDQANSTSLRLVFDSTVFTFSIIGTAWQHFTLTVTGNTYQAFINKVSKTSGSYGSGISKSYIDLNLGRGSENTSQSWNGNIDDFRIYNKVLSSGEISDVYDELF